MKLRVASNALNNVVGGIVPAAALLLTMPYIVRGLGLEGYGLFTLITAIIGYFAVIDINVTAGAVKQLSHFHALGRNKEASEVMVLGALVYLGIGSLGALLVLLVAEPLATTVLGLPPHQLPLARECLKVAAVGFFFGQLQAYLLSMPQALLRYDVSARIEALFGVLLPCSTVLVLYLGYGLLEVLIVRVSLSALNCCVLLVQTRRLAPWFTWSLPSRQTVREVSGFSAYAFMSRMAALSYTYLDKLVIGGTLGLKALSYYTVAATLGNRIMALMFRISAVAFPASSALAARGDMDQLRTLYLRLNRYICFANAGLLMVLACVAEPLLGRWLGDDFAREGTLVLQLVAVAQFIDSLTNLPSLVNDGLGHAKTSGLFAVTRAVLGLGAISVMVHLGGIEGVALAHLMSALVMTLAFLAFVHGRTVPCRLRDLIHGAYYPGLFIALGTGTLTLGAVYWLSGQGAVQLVPVALLMVTLAWAGMRYVLLPNDREALVAWIARRR